MTRASVVYTPQARSDLREIVTFLKQVAGSRVGAQWKVKLLKLCATLRDFPSIGTPVLEFGPRRRRLAEAPYVIFYDTPLPKRVVIVRILDGRRDLPSLFAASNDD